MPLPNFQHRAKEPDKFEDRVGMAEGGAMYCVLRVSALLVRLARDGFISINDVIKPKREFKLVPKRTLKFVSDIFVVNQNKMRSMFKEVFETET